MQYARNNSARRVMYAFIVATLVAACMYFVRQTQPHVMAATMCISAYNLGLSGSTTAGTAAGVVNVILGSPTNTTTTVQKVIIRANGQPIGRAQPTSSYSWSMPWVTSLHPNGSVSVDAEVYVGTQTSPCTTQPQMVEIHNATQTSLAVSAQPARWQRPMSFSFPITLSTTTPQTSFNSSLYAIYSWSTTIGNISPDNHIAQFSSGQTTGTGMVKATVKYGGSVVSTTIPITVDSFTAPLPASSLTASNTTTTTTAGQTTTSSQTTQQATTTATALRTAALQNNPTVESCVIGIVGAEQFTVVNTGVSRPTSDTIEKFKVCFASSNYLLPSNFAPVAPKTVKELPKNDAIKVADLKNITTTTQNGSKEGLRFQGKALPNQTVFMYIFSDPLVLTTTADSNGNWEYTLKDPIEPGKHEVYTVVDRGNGSYERSQPFSFIIDTATAAEANPNGLSLQLVEEPTPKQANSSFVRYIVASALAVLLVLLAFLLVFRKLRKPQTAANTGTANPDPATINIQAPGTDDNSGDDHMQQ